MRDRTGYVRGCSRGDMRTQKRLNGEIKETETAGRNRNSNSFQSSLRFLKYVSPFCKNNRSFNEVSRDRKAAERCRSSKVTSREMLLRRERSDDCFKPRVTTQRIPKRVKT